ncbi:T9SS type A sorting domain-containing protein [Winogradskyella aurantia]|nr:Ig-like domain-containing protein [Winogradskyella aurantia]
MIPTLRDTIIKLINSLLIIIVFHNVINSQQLAFPTAYGAGANTTGGRGGAVIHVTNLNDSGAGSLREALLTPGTRTVIFDISGVIDLQSQIYISSSDSDRSNLTVNGFSAPNGGITIIGAAIRSGEGTENMIWRGIRFRNGYLAAEPNGSLNTSCLGFRGASNVIVDRCSFAYARSKGVGIGTSGPGEYAEKITIQNCLFGESQQAMLVGNSEAVEFGNSSILRNVTSNVGWRHPKGGGAMDLDVINNFHNNWQARTIRMDAYDFNLNLIGNYYQGGGVTGVGERDDKAIFATWTNATMNPQIWDEDNFIEAQHRPINYPAQPESAWFPFATSTEPVKSEWFVSNRLPLQGVDPAILSAQDLKTELFPKVGACEYIDNNGNVQFFRDDIDIRLIELADNDSGGGYISSSEYQNLATQIIMPSETRPANFYITNPHIPEVWFQANVPEGQDHNDIAPSGYTWLEEYLNQVDVDVTAIGVEGVAVTPSTAELQVPETLTLTVTISPDDATNQTGVWSSSDEAIATVDSNGVVTAVSEGEVTITFTTNDGGLTASTEITVFPEALQASAGDDQTICEGESITLTATSNNGTTYLWSTGDATPEIEVSPTESSTYTVTVSNDVGEEVTDDVVVTVNPVPVANAGNDETICQGESITLTASGGTTYLWSTGETTASITVSPDSETIYTVEAISNECSSTDAVLISVMPSPEISITDDTYIYIGDSTTLTVSGAETYVWNTGESTESITVSPEVTTTYSVTGFANGCETTAEVLVTVLPPTNAYAGEDVTICSGETVTLNATGGISYNWDSGQTEASIDVSPTQTTTYTVTVTDALGGTDMDEVTVTVNETPIVTVSDDVIIMEGESTTLTANGAPSFFWNTGYTSDTIIVSPTQTTTYTVTGSNGNCEATAEVVVTVIPEVIANAGANVTICSGESVNLTATGGTNYSWDSGEQVASITVSPAQTTTYTVTVSDNFGNSDSDSVTVTVNETPVITISDSVSIIEGESTVLVAEGADSYLWSTGETTQSITVSPTQTTIYTVTGASNGCEAEAEVTVNVEELFQATAGDNQRVCQDDNYEVELTAGPGDTYLWNTGETTQTIYVSPVSTSTYTVTVTQGNQEDTASVTVFVDPNPDVVIANGDTVDILNGDFITLSASGANNYQWSNGATQPNIAVSPSETTTYEVRGYVNDCYDEKQVTVNVYQPVVADAGEDVLICLDESAILTASGGDEYLWSTGEITQSIEVSPQATTEYTVTVFNAMDYDEDSVIVGINDSCSDDSTEQPDESLDFSVMVYPNPATTYANIRLSGVLEITEMLMYDFTGKLILQREINNEDYNATVIEKVDVRDLRHGVYFLKLIDNDKEIVKKIIVN